MTTRKYSSRSQQTTLAANLTDSATSCTVVSGSALLGGATVPAGTTFTVVIDPDTALEEIVDVTVVSTNVLTITRGVENAGTGQAHSAGAAVRHMAIGRDFREANLHIEATGGYNDGTGAHTMHGIASGEGDVVGTAKTQTLTNKTLTSPTITNPSITGAGVDASIVFEGATPDAFETTLTVVDPTQDNTITMPNTTGTVVIATAVQTLTNKTLTSPTISGSPVITGLSSAGMSASSATPKDYVDSILGSATAAATSAASAATSAASAATSAGSSETSAIASATSASASASSATAAATSATSAAASATAAATSATSAAASATTAANSVATIAGYATSAANSATAAATSATSAATSAASAAASTSAAAASATAAATSATSAASSASAAATSASSAATSATSAATSATSAAASAASAAAAVAASFDAKGDLLVGTGASAFDQLTVATTNGYLLSVNSATATGLAWTAAVAGYTAPTLGSTSIASGATVTNVDALTINSTTIPTSKTLVVTTDKLSALAATTSAELAGVISDEIGTGNIQLSDLATSAQTASYTLVLADKGKLVEMSNASANNLTVPLNSSVAYPVGSQINILQTGAGQTTVVATGGVTINASPGLKLRAQWSAATLIKRATDTWVLVGDLSA